MSGYPNGDDDYNGGPSRTPHSYQSPTSSTYDRESSQNVTLSVNGRQSPPSPTEGLVTFTPYFFSKRHISTGEPSKDLSVLVEDWRVKDKLKTSHACLLVCLNIGVEPPDVVKTTPHAKLECWIDPFQLQPSRALDAIGKNLQAQFESLNPRMKYKPCLDPTLEDIKKFCTILRRTAKDERALVYYNGHGVPKPTTSGEIWAFNAKYTQYIPVSLADLHSWVGSPAIFIWDSTSSGHIVNNYLRIQREREAERTGGATPQGSRGSDTSNADYSNDPWLDASIHLASCLPGETLPMAPELPADVFTSCLTSPIEMALRYFCLQNILPLTVDEEMVMQLPGDLKDRRTPLGELNWIFTSVTDTIAWTTFPRDTFLGLFRHDLMIAALFRNYLLAERVLRRYQCIPMSHPPLPATHNHPMWDSWDLAVEGCLSQLPGLLKGMGKPMPPADPDNPLLSPDVMARHQSLPPDTFYHYINSPFFADNLTAFETWLSRGGSTPPSWTERASVANPHPRRPPEQLPILLQVLLAQAHRLRALVLLSQFVDLGTWAVHYALIIGVFPYVQRLLQSPAAELKPVLVFIWARMMAVDPTCQTDLTTNQGYVYFANILAPEDDEQYGPHAHHYGPVPNGAEQRAMCAFILAMFARDNPAGQQALLREHVLDSCFARLDEEDYLVKQWALLCIAAIWEGNDEAKAYAVTLGAHERLLQLRNDESAEVRAATMFTLGVFLGCSTGDGKLLIEDGQYAEKTSGGGSGALIPLDDRDQMRMEVNIAMEALVAGKEDASPLVRKELVVLLSAVVKEWRGWCVMAGWVYLEEDRAWRLGQIDTEGESEFRQALEEWFTRGDSEEEEYEADEDRRVLKSFFILITTLFELAVDPHPVVAHLAQKVVDYIICLVLVSPFANLPFSTFNTPLPRIPGHASHEPEREARKRVSSLTPTLSGRAPQLPMPAPLTRTNTTDSFKSERAAASSRVGSSLKRVSSIASTLRSFYTLPGKSNAHSEHSNGNASQEPSVRPSSRSRPSSFYMPTQTTSPSSSHAPIPSPSSSNFPRGPNVVMIISEVVNDDMERLKHRRRAPYSPSAASSRSRSPSSNYYSDMDDSISFASQIRLGPDDESRPMPLSSPFFDWSAEYYREPQMKRPEAEEPGSVQYNDQMYRKLRNERMVLHAAQQADEAMRHPWDRPIGQLNTHSVPLNMKFHQYETHLGMTNESDSISIWDWSEKKRLARFVNGNPKGTGITSLHFINEDVIGMVLTTSSDGVARIHRNYYEQDSVQLISAFRAIPEITTSTHGSGVVSEWQQSSGTLIAGGDSRVVRVWNAGKEVCIAEPLTNVNSCLTSISSDQFGCVFVCGFGNGTIQVFDHRLEAPHCVVASITQHRSWVQSVHWRSDGQRDILSARSVYILSASVDGEVRLWDLRDAERSIADWRIQSRGLSSFAMHEQTPVFATLSQISPASFRSQTLLVHSLDGLQTDILSRSNVPTGLYGMPAKPSPSAFVPFGTSVTFHRNEMMYAVGGLEGSIRLMGLALPVKEKSPLSELYEVDDIVEDWARS